jgi:hypothetical protein
LGLVVFDDVSARHRAALFSTGLHALFLAGLLAAAALAPPELVERVIPVQLMPPRPAVELPGTLAEPAPAGPRAVGIRRPNAAALAAAEQQLTPEQAAALRAAALEVARRSIQSLQLEAERAPELPAQIARRPVEAERLAARAAAAISAERVLEVENFENIAIDPEDLAALDLDLAAPRKIDPIHLGDLSAAEALRVLENIEPSEYSGRLASGAAPAADAPATVEAGMLDLRLTDGYPGGPGGGDGGAGAGAGSGGQGEVVGAVRCLESAPVQRYLGHVQRRTRKRWTVPAGIERDARVVLHFSLNRAGMARDMEAMKGRDAILAESAIQALRSASPFPPMNDANRCLADKRIVLTFTVPPR